MNARILFFFLAIPTFLGFSSTDFTGAFSDPVIITLDEYSNRFQLYPEGPVTPVLLKGLEKGHTYQVSVIQDSGDCYPKVGAVNAENPITIYVFEASDDHLELEVEIEYLKKACQDVVYFTVFKHEAEFVPVPNPTLLPTLTTSSGSTPQQLVEDVLIGGGCFSVDGVSFSGSPGSRGTFANGITNIGLGEGVILSSGPISVAPGPNNSTGAGGPTGGGGDLDLQILAAGSVLDAAVLEFDFQPTEPIVTFRYVFASEEYCDYVNSTFNDVFGFFISGPGLSGPFSNDGVNIAVIPGTSTPVAINNVNHMMNPAYYISNVSPDDFAQLATPGCAGTPVGTFPIINELQYDGFTVVLTATATVIPCETYHIKLAVSDVGDQVFDSAVFLEANSFDAGGEGEVVANNPVTGDNHAYEECDSGFLVFTRTAGDPSLPLTINYTIGGSATPGADYAPLPTSVTIPPFVNQIQIPITVFADAIVEGIENILIILDQPCNCDANTAEFLIEDLPILNASIEDVEVCAGLPVVINPTVTGGVPPYFYEWSNGSPAPTYIDVPLTDGTVEVTVTDFCGQMTTATANVDVFTLEAELTGSGQICTSGDEADLMITFTGSGPWDVTYTIDGDGPFNINGITDNPYTLVATEPGEYEIVAIISGGCLGEGIGVVEVTSSDTQLDGTETDLACAGDSDGSIDLNVTGTTGPYTYDWSNGVSVEDPANLPADTYSVTVTDDAGCEEEISFVIDEPTVIDPQVVSTVGVDCDDPTGGSIDLEVSGGAGNYTYQWSNGDEVQDPTGLAAGNYDVVVTDDNGCTATITATVSGDSNVPEADILVVGQIDCINTLLDLDGTGSSSGPGIVYDWVASNGGNIVSAPDQPTVSVDAAGTYQLTVTNTSNGCFSTTSVIVQADLNTPVSDAGPGNELTCTLTELNLNGNGSSSGVNIVYDWTTSDGNITSPTDITNPTVDAPGTYQLVVMNSDNGCADTSFVSITEDVIIPVSDPGADETIDCIETSVFLDGTNSTSGPNITYVWTTTDGNIINGANSANPEVDEAGTYQLLVLNTVNGCQDSSLVVVDDLGDAPIITIANPDTLTCDLVTLDLDGTGSSSGPEFEYQWTSSGGGNILTGDTTLTPTVDQSGTYQLEILNTLNGCTSILDVDVEANQASPTANAGPTFEISCTDPTVNLDGSGSAIGSNIEYQWITVDGGNIVSGDDTIDPLIDAPGTYQLTVTNTETGCASSSLVTITGDAETPVASAFGPGDLNCDDVEVVINGTGSSIGSSFSYQWTTSDGSIVSGETNLFLIVDGAGTYTLSVINSNNNCISTTDVTVGIDTLQPSAEADVLGLLTCTVTELTLDGTASTQGPDINYLWETPDGNIVSGGDTPSPVVDAPGTYTLLVENGDNGCENETTVVVDENVIIPDADAQNTAILNCAVDEIQIDGTNSSQGGNISYLWDTTDGNVVAGGDTDQPTVNAPGTYEVLVTDTDNGCTNTAEVTVSQDIENPTADPGSALTLTCDVTSQDLDGSFSQPFSDLDFEWTTSDGSILTDPTMASTEIDAPGTYQLVVVDNTNFCADTATIVVAQDIIPPLAEAGSTFELDCNATALNLDGTGSSTGNNFSYTWSTMNGNIVSGNDALDPLVNAPGTYELLVLNTDNGCTTIDLVDITQDDDAPEAEAIADGTITCANTEVLLDGSGSTGGVGLIYTWEELSGAGTITTGQGTNQATVDGPGVFQLTVFNTNNDCQTITTVEVDENTILPTVVAQANEDITCDNLEVTLEGVGSSAGPEYTYSWTTLDGSFVGGQDQLDATAGSAGTYTLEIVNTDNGCIDATQVVVDENTVIPSAAINSPEELNCAVLNIELDATGSDQGPDFDFTWTTLDGNIVSNGDTPQPVVDAPGTYDLTLLNTVNGCSTVVTVEVDQDIEDPLAEAGPTFELTCVVTSLNLDGTGSDQGATYSYDWEATNGGSIQSGNTTLNPTITSAGTYTLTVLNTDNQCSSEDIVTVTEDVIDPTVVIANPADITCLVDEVNIDAGGSDSGPDFEYTWTTTGGNIIDDTNPLAILVNAPGTYTLSILNLDNGCTESLSVPVGEDIALPGADAGPTFELNCNLENVDLEGTSGSSDVSFNWGTVDGQINGGSNSANPTVSAPGTYSLTVTDLSNGCESTDDVVVSENNPADFDFDMIPPACSDDAGVIQFVGVNGGVPPYEYSIDGGASFSNNSFFTALDPGAYDVAIQDANGCSLLDEVILPQGVDVDIEIEDYVLVQLGDSYQINALTNIPTDDIAEIIWSPTEGLSCTDCLNPIVEPLEQIDYKLTIKTADGCEATEIISLRVNKKAAVFIPNIFSPDGDGDNDLFMIFAGDQVAKINSFQVFDRWGETVYQHYNFLPNDPAFSWNGELRGTPLNPGVFVYFAEIEFIDGRVELFEGDVTLVR